MFSVKPNINCRNRNKHCDAWFKRGECKKSLRYMKIYCQKACNLCGQFSLKIIFIITDRV